jgi:hypothetical protein
MLHKDFVKEYMEVHHRTFKPTTIITAFQKSGCWPVNCNVFTDVYYTPSILTSTSSCHVSSCFPVGIHTPGSQDLNDESNNENPNNSKLDDNLSSSDTNDAADDGENLQTNTGTVILPGV